MSALSRRESSILNSIVKAYLESGEPVASQSLARIRGVELSAASIRNVMADLAEQGYLAQPHASAGRIPTPAAIQTYVKTLAVQVVASELAKMRRDLERAQTVEDRMERSSRILTEWTHNAAIAAAIPAAERVLREVQFVVLPERRLLMVVVTAGGEVLNQVVDLAEALGETELVSIRNYVNRSFAGWTLSSARRELERRLRVESLTYDSVLRRLMELHLGGLLDVALDQPEVSLDGASNLLAIDLHLTREAMRDLFRTLEEKKRLLDLLDRYLEKATEGPEVRVGLDEIHPSMGGLAVVGIGVDRPDGTRTRVAVLGPHRMDYARAISAVSHMHQALRSM
ncbi:MAG: heat-inducible transcriptional repressor HrcA [Bryobacteraceae bacterium]|nr:heat-inducible transcriptional repressor HrcA [Bryobacteraceae bacterium]